jgi:hypothetical protein
MAIIGVTPYEEGEGGEGRGYGGHLTNYYTKERDTEEQTVFLHREQDRIDIADSIGQ